MGRSVLAAALSQPPTHRRPLVSDTTLKFRYEVTEALRRAGCSYDMDLRLGVDLRVDVATSGVRPMDGALWLLDGPECFHRPFISPDSGLSLVPAEQRRIELLETLRSDSAVAAMHEALAQWAD